MDNASQISHMSSIEIYLWLWFVSMNPYSAENEYLMSLENSVDKDQRAPILIYC